MTDQQRPFVPKSAMVLSAGLGTRMRPMTETVPKPLIKVADKHLIDYALDRFSKAGVERAIVNVHYLADMVETHVIKRSKPEIIISDERSLLLETGGGLKKAAPHFLGDAIYCTNTDAILIDDDETEAATQLAKTWCPEKMDALLLLAPIEKTSGYAGAGDFDCNDDGRLSFRTGETAPYVFTGLQILTPKLLEGSPNGAFSTKILWDKALQNGRLYGLVHRGFWMHVGDPAGLQAAEDRLSKLNQRQ